MFFLCKKRKTGENVYAHTHTVSVYVIHIPYYVLQNKNVVCIAMHTLCKGSSFKKNKALIFVDGTVTVYYGYMYGLDLFFHEYNHPIVTIVTMVHFLSLISLILQ